MQMSFVVLCRRLVSNIHSRIHLFRSSSFDFDLDIHIALKPKKQEIWTEQRQDFSFNVIQNPFWSITGTLEQLHTHVMSCQQKQ